MKNGITTEHSIPGRIRFKIPAIRNKPEKAQAYQNAASQIPGVLWAGGNPKSGSLVVRYDSGTLDGPTLRASLNGGPQPPGRRPGDLDASPATKKNRTNGDSRPSGLVRFAGLTALTAGVFFREAVLKTPVSQALFSPLGVMVALASLPLVRSGLRNLSRGSVTLESFLGGGVLVAAAAGEAKAALEILWITSGGELLQNWITERSRRAIADILQITEKETYILKDGVEISLPVDQVRPGDTVVLHTGEKVSVDGQVIKGEAIIDDSPITGRSEPAAAGPGSKVFAGSFIRKGVIFVEAVDVGDGTYLSRILRMVEDSLDNKAPIQGAADRLAQTMVKLGFASTAAAFLITGSLWRAFTVMLVMACPCATILAASTAVSAALNVAARRRILIKGGRYLEDISQADVLCFDKTGTLTTNMPELMSLINLNGMPDEDLLQLVYSTELHNSHPLALSIKHEAEKRGVKPIQHEVCEYYLGLGVRAEIHGEEILVGSRKLMQRHAIWTQDEMDQFEESEKRGLTLIFLARNRELIGALGFANRDREDVAGAVSRLKNDGFKKMVMITGDAKYSALEMACRLDFDECLYSVQPEEKAEVISRLKSEGAKVLMVGDGINDALALAEADIGVAMGAGGSEAAIEAADIALVQDDLSDVYYVRALSRKTLTIIRQNFWIATGTNIAGAAFGVLGLLSPVSAGLLHIGHTLGVLANSSRLLFHEPDAGVSPQKSEQAVPPPADQ